MSASSPLRLFAHRGVSARFPENTLPAFIAARDEGCSAIELDVQLTRDGHLVVFHDDDLFRMTGNPARISELDYADLMRVDVGAWKGAEFQGARIPTLAEVFGKLGQGLIVNVELKASGAGNAALAAAAASVVQTRGAPVVVSSFDWQLLSQYHRCDAGTPTAVLIEDRLWEAAAQFAPQVGAVAINGSVASVNPADVTKTRALGYDVNIFTVNDAATARRLQALGVTGIFTDDAPRLAVALGQAA